VSEGTTRRQLQLEDDFCCRPFALSLFSSSPHRPDDSTSFPCTPTPFLSLSLSDHHLRSSSSPPLSNQTSSCFLSLSLPSVGQPRPPPLPSSVSSSRISNSATMLHSKSIPITSLSIQSVSRRLFHLCCFEKQSREQGGEEGKERARVQPGFPPLPPPFLSLKIKKAIVPIGVEKDVSTRWG